MNVVLVRNAKAEPVDYEILRHGKITGIDPKKENALRELTQEGFAEFRQSISSIRDLFLNQKPLALWSSTLVRADQTAKIIGDLLDIKEISYFEFINTGDFNEFKNELLKQDRQATIIVVGSEPFLGNWIFNLLEAEIKLGLGEVIAVSLAGQELEQASLQWTKKPQEPTVFL